ncbi:MAG TPA: SMI1/KNR4 family protein [Ktedonobacteraceae bacterium]
MSEQERYREFCDQVCTYLMSQQLGIPSQWDMPISRFFQGMPRDNAFRKDIRLAVTSHCIHYYRRTAVGEEYAIQPEGPLEWLPHHPTLLYPPATDEQLQATEEALGFPLPPLLRALYAQVANGGFGPGYGLLGAIGGGNEDGWLLTGTYQRAKADTRPIDLLTCERLATPIENRGGFYKFISDLAIPIPRGYWPESLLPLSHDGCALFFHLDRQTGRIFYGGDGDGPTLYVIATSLEDLLRRWMNDELFDYPAFQQRMGTHFGDQPFFEAFDPLGPFLDRDL